MPEGVELTGWIIASLCGIPCNPLNLRGMKNRY